MRTSKLTNFLCLCFLIWTGLVCIGGGEEERPDLSAVCRRGVKTRERFKTNAASWTIIIKLRNGTISTSVLHSPPYRRLAVSLEASGRRIDAMKIVMRDGFWYVSEDTANKKYRPYTASFKLPGAYYYLYLSDTRVLTQPEILANSTYEGTTGETIEYRIPPPPASALQLQNYLNELKDNREKDSELKKDAQLGRTIKEMEELLEKGFAWKINAGSGLIEASDTARYRSELLEFQWLNAVDPGEFAVDQEEWTDCAEPLSEDPADRMMIGYAATYSLENKQYDPDGHILDLKTGRFWRIPFEGLASIPGCFLADRARVIISGFSGVDGALRPYEVNLITGQSRPLGDERLSTGFSMMLALSPEGKTLALSHKGSAEKLLESQIYLIELETDRATPLGKPMDAGSLSWLPDGQGLVFPLREYPEGPKSTGTRTVARMNLRGEVSKLFRGDMPVVLSTSGRILYLDDEDHIWKTRRLDGSDAQLFAYGLPKHNFPTVSPDGNEVILMKYSQGAPPRPYRFKVGEKLGRPVTSADGFWATPAWK